MTFKELKNKYSFQQQQEQEEQLSSSGLALLSDRLRNKPFWIWNIEEHRQVHKITKGNCCFNHILGCPEKNGTPKPMFDYEQIIFNVLQSHRCVWIKKSTGLGITEFFLRFIAYLCLRDNALSGSQICIVTGPRIDLAIGLIARMKKMFTLKQSTDLG
ncbi:MAG TPA: hypothetical protein VFI70_11930, partial [Nitrososphaeraceae archaeon]|nr:hypothetical protein [Nitrososphaeraceae archaeon]